MFIRYINILSFIISLAGWMNLLVVAEGVETREQIELLRSLNCNYVQGYYYNKPMPTKDFTALLVSAPVAVFSIEAAKESAPSISE